MSKKILKNVNWIIPVPNKDDIEDKSVYTTEFPIEFNGKITTWNLQHNFNGERRISNFVSKLLFIKFSKIFLSSLIEQKNEHFGVFLLPKSGGIDFDVEFTFIVLDWIDMSESTCHEVLPVLAEDW